MGYKEDEKRLTVNLKKVVHQEIKRRALFRNITLRRWIEIAIKNQIKKELETE